MSAGRRAGRRSRPRSRTVQPHRSARGGRRRGCRGSRCGRRDLARPGPRQDPVVGDGRDHARWLAVGRSQRLHLGAREDLAAGGRRVRRQPHAVSAHSTRVSTPARPRAPAASSLRRIPSARSSCRSLSHRDAASERPQQRPFGEFSIAVDQHLAAFVRSAGGRHEPTTRSAPSSGRPGRSWAAVPEHSMRRSGTYERTSSREEVTATPKVPRRAE